MNNAIFDNKTGKQRKRLFEVGIKTEFVTQKILDNDLAMIHKIKINLTLKNQHMSECVY